MAAARIVQALKDLAAAYTGRSQLPAPHPHRVGAAAQLVHAAQLTSLALPEALLDPRLAQPISEARDLSAHSHGWEGREQVLLQCTTISDNRQSSKSPLHQCFCQDSWLIATVSHRSS